MAMNTRVLGKPGSTGKYFIKAADFWLLSQSSRVMNGFLCWRLRTREVALRRCDATNQLILRNWAVLEAASCADTQDLPSIFCNVFIRTVHWSIFWARPIQFIQLHPISPRSVLILSTHLRLGPPSRFLNVIYVVSYDYTIRITSISHQLIGSISFSPTWFSWPVIMAYSKAGLKNCGDKAFTFHVNTF
jgi:hypothetical protein